MRDETASTPHPDTGLLAAFAQNALSARECHSILLHLGECARCRDIVFLAQQAALAEAPVTAASARRFPLRRGWPLVASALAALLIAAVSMVWVHHRLRNTSDNATIALGSQPPAHAAIPAGNPTEAKPARPEAAARHVPPPPASATSLAGARESGMQMEARAEKQEQLRAQVMEAQQDRRQAMMKSESALAPRAATEMPSAPAMVTSASSAKPGTPAFDADAHPASAASHSRPAYSLDEMPMPSASAAPPMAAKPRAPLPSGLRTVSSLRVEGRTLALDAAGALFASEDNGRNWQRLATPWTGKALLLSRLPSSASTHPGGNGTSDATSDGEAAVEVFCSTQERWISLDRGQTWKLATPPTSEQR
ncbi:MAG: hypothetical protein WBM14_13245 [Terracidiphilus sp.]